MKREEVHVENDQEVTVQTSIIKNFEGTRRASKRKGLSNALRHKIEFFWDFR